VSNGTHQRLFVRGSSPTRIAIRIFYFVLSEARKEPEDLPASVGGVAVLAPVERIGHPSSFLNFFFVFHFPFTANFLFVDSGLGEGLFRRYRLLLLLDPFDFRLGYFTFTSSFGE
jgi:hypothetical protein